MEVYKNTKRRKGAQKIVWIIIFAIVGASIYYFWIKPGQNPAPAIEATIVEPTQTIEPTATNTPLPPTATPYPAPEDWVLVPGQELEEWQKFKLIEDLTIFWNLFFHPEGRPNCEEALAISAIVETGHENFLRNCIVFEDEGLYMKHLPMSELSPTFIIEQSDDGRIYPVVRLDTVGTWYREVHYWEDAAIKEINSTKQAIYGLLLLPDNGLWKVNSYVVNFYD